MSVFRKILPTYKMNDPLGSLLNELPSRASSVQVPKHLSTQVP